MNICDVIDLANKPPGLRFLVIGGYAVGAHGHTRTTFDIDFLVCKVDREVWVEKMIAGGLMKTAETKAFAQFSQPDGEGVDLMFVNAPTFAQMWSVSEERPFGGNSARVPCLDHLIALKLHALKQKSPHRTSKDAEDVEILARRNGLDISERRYEELFLKYGTREIYETFLRILRH